MENTMKRIMVILFLIITIVRMIGFDLSNPIYASSDNSTDVNLTKISDKAYIFTLPLYIMYRTRWNSVYNPDRLSTANVNEFQHGRRLADPTWRAVTNPNNDTLIHLPGSI
jgi:hypothetical protein